MSRTLAALLLPAVVFAQSVPERIDAALDSSPLIRQAYWGVRIIDVSSGSVVYEKNADHGFIPASNTKLFSTALALMRLGPDYKFVTSVVTAAPPDTHGSIEGDLRLVGTGDPNLSARILPYNKDELTGTDPLKDIESLADQVVKNGVRRIEGNIVGDDTAFAYEPYPSGWAIDDPIWEYGAPVSALSLNDNSVSITIWPGTRDGELASVEVNPTVSELVVLNHVRTMEGATKISFDRLPGSNELTIRGQIARKAGPYKEAIAVEDPAQFAARALRSELIKRGVAVAGTAVAAHRDPDDVSPARSGMELARHVSHPLVEDLQVTDKESENLHAELALLQVARVKNGIGSREAALTELQAFLSEAGIEPREYHFEDGSGLSRLGLVTPAAITKLLVYMYNSKYRGHWINLLPIGGEDGTLRHRFVNATRAGAVHAKTGSITHVSALSGYILPENGKVYAFSIIVNNLNGPAAEARAVADKIVLTIANGK